MSPLRWWVLALAATLAAAAQKDYAMKLQQAVGSANIAARDGDHGKALAKLDQMQALLTEWRGALEALQTEAASPKPVEEEAPLQPPEESIEFEMNRTFIPEKCPRTSQKGSTMKVHYVGKLIKTKKIFSSSFHTGSQPFRFVLGSKEVVEAWNKGLLDMCEGERRRLMVPWKMGHGEKGTKGVPPFSDLQYDLELVEMSNSKRKTEL